MKETLFYKRLTPVREIADHNIDETEYCKRGSKIGSQEGVSNVIHQTINQLIATK